MWKVKGSEYFLNALYGDEEFQWTAVGEDGARWILADILQISSSMKHLISIQFSVPKTTIFFSVSRIIWLVNGSSFKMLNILLRNKNRRTGRVFVLKFKAGSKRLFFWMQESKTDKDEEYCRKENEYLNNPNMPGLKKGTHSSVLGEGGLQSLLSNMSHNQLMQLIGPTGLGGFGALAGPGLASLLSSGGPAAGSSQVPTTPITPSATSAVSPMASPATPVSPSLTAGAASPTQSIQLSDLQSILATMNVPAAGQGVNLASVVTPEIMAPILANAEVQERLLPFLPSGEALPQSTNNSTTYSPPHSFSSALASGQSGPLMNQFGLPTEAVDAANKGEAFAKAMETDSKSDHEDDDSKDKDDERYEFGFVPVSPVSLYFINYLLADLLFRALKQSTISYQNIYLMECKTPTLNWVLKL
uniref:Proteasomal ubiquitin receptor ADRM1 n=1 Tax=Oncorhynchus mykiss TaxID=8022 RepID=A0A8C7Q608_ONCMY